jgi:hypothetical protein
MAVSISLTVLWKPTADDGCPAVGSSDGEPVGAAAGVTGSLAAGVDGPACSWEVVEGGSAMLAGDVPFADVLVAPVKVPAGAGPGDNDGAVAGWAVEHAASVNAANNQARCAAVRGWAGLPFIAAASHGRSIRNHRVRSGVPRYRAADTSDSGRR